MVERTIVKSTAVRRTARMQVLHLLIHQHRQRKISPSRDKPSSVDWV